MKVIADGSLAIDTAFGELSERKPVAYQTVNGRRAEVPVGVKVAGNSYAFAVGQYDSSRPLVIDPALLYSTYLGGVHDDAGFDIAVDSVGNAYVTGASASQNFPITANAFQTIRSNLGTYTYDIFVTKLSPNGVVLYSTFIGGSNNDYGYAIAVDGNGSAYIGGQTLSLDYPTTKGAFQTTFNNCVEGLVTKLSPDGSSLVFSTFLGGLVGTTCGGEEGDNIVSGLALDASQNVFVTGPTGSSDFPTTPGAFLTKMPEQPATRRFGSFVTKLKADGSAPVYSTFLGGETYDWATGVAVDSVGRAYVTGFTGSSKFPVTAGAFQTAFKGGAEYDSGGAPSGTDAFLAVLKPDGAGLVCATYLGGTSDEFGRRVVSVAERRAQFLDHGAQ